MAQGRRTPHGQVRGAVVVSRNLPGRAASPLCFASETGELGLLSESSGHPCSAPREGQDELGRALGLQLRMGAPE